MFGNCCLQLPLFPVLFLALQMTNVTERFKLLKPFFLTQHTHGIGLPSWSNNDGLAMTIKEQRGHFRISREEREAFTVLESCPEGDDAPRRRYFLPPHLEHLYLVRITPVHHYIRVHFGNLPPI